MKITEFREKNDERYAINMKKNRLISVVMPVYNGGKMLSDSIESVLNQTYDNIELIIVNDYSTDNTESIIDNYASKDSRVVKINNPRNLKLPATLNVGFQRAEGEYWTWTSADNKYKPTAIATMAEIMDNNTEVGFVYANFTAIDSNGNVLYERELESSDSLQYGNCIGACFLYKKECAIKAGQYDITLFLAEDYDYWIRLSRETKIHHINESLYYYRRHENSLTSTRETEISIQTYKVLEKHFLYLYGLLQSSKDKIRFLDVLNLYSQKMSDTERQFVLGRLCKVYPKYGVCLKYRKIHHSIGKTWMGDVWRKIKRYSTR